MRGDVTLQLQGNVKQRDIAHTNTRASGQEVQCSLRRAPRLRERAAMLIDECTTLIAQATVYSRAHFEDLPEIRDWVWTTP